MYVCITCISPPPRTRTIPPSPRPTGRSTALFYSYLSSGCAPPVPLVYHSLTSVLQPRLRQSSPPYYTISTHCRSDGARLRLGLSAGICIRMAPRSVVCLSVWGGRGDVAGGTAAERDLTMGPSFGARREQLMAKPDGPKALVENVPASPFLVVAAFLPSQIRAEPWESEGEN